MGRNIFTTLHKIAKIQFVFVNVFLTSKNMLTEAKKGEKLSNSPINVIKEMDQFVYVSAAIFFL